MKSHWKHRLLSVILAVCLVFSQSMIHASSHAEGAPAEPEIEETGGCDESDLEEKVAVDDVSPSWEGRAIVTPIDTSDYRASVTIGEETTSYPFFGSAFDKAKNQVATIQLLVTDATTGELEVAGENSNITLDLQGQKLFGGDNAYFNFKNVILISEGSLTIKDSDTDGGIEDNYGRNCVYVTGSGELILEKGIIGKVNPTTVNTRASMRQAASSSYAVKVDNGAKAVVNGGSVTSLYVDNGGSVEINNGYIYNYERTENATVSISGGYFKDEVKEEDCAIGYRPTTEIVQEVAGEWYSVEACNHIVKFETNGGSSIAEEEIGHRGTVLEPSDPTREGYKFENWYTEKECINPYNFNEPVKNDLTLYAKWTAIEYDITVKQVSNGTVSSSPQKATVGSKITLNVTPDEGYQLKGWGVVPSRVKIENNSFIMPAANVTITPKWEKKGSSSGGGSSITYCTLTFDTNGGSSLNGVSVVYGSRLDFSKYTTTREGYDFSGWYTDKELTKAVDSNTAITHSMILYAKWTEKEPEDIKTGIILEIPVQTDNGDKQQPDVKVTFGDETLTEGTDYHVTYKNNEEPGKATVVITGSGRYTGELTQDFIIVPQKVTGLQAVKKTTTTLKLTFDKVRGADGYEIYDAESDVHIASCSTQNGAEQLVRTLTDLTPGELRQYKVRAYVLVDGKRYYGEFSDVYSQATDVAKPVLMATIAKSGKTAQTLQWNKISQADGYIIYGCKCGGNGKKLKTIKGNSTTKWTKRNLSPGKYYKYYVAAYQNIDGSQTEYVKSPYAHAVTTSSKYTNPSKIAVNRSTITLARKKTTTIKATVTIPTGKTIRQHCGKVRYKTSDKTIAAVTSTGKIKGVYTGTCYIYAYTQNGIYKKIKVTVK